MRPGSPDDDSGNDDAFDDLDVSAPDTPLDTAEWHVDRSIFFLKIAGVVAFAVLPSVLALNGASRLFGLVLAVVLAGYAIRDVIAPVRLSADAEGVTVIRGYAGHRRLAWPEIERLRVDARRRSEFLEVDTGESLHLFSRYDLSMPPSEALAMLERVRP